MMCEGVFGDGCCWGVRSGAQYEQIFCSFCVFLSFVSLFLTCRIIGGHDIFVEVDTECVTGVCDI